MSSISRVAIAFVLTCVFSMPAAGEPDTDPVFSTEVVELGQLIDQSEYLKVLEDGPVLLQRLRELHPDGSADEAKVLDFLVYASYRSRAVMNPAAIEWGQGAISLKERILGAGSPELANSLMHLGNLHSRRWEPGPAVPYYERAVSILERAGEDHDAKRAVILSSQGVAYRRLAQKDKAMELFLAAREIQERLLGPDHPDLASTLNNCGTVLAEQGDYTASAAMHRRAMKIREDHFGPGHEWVAESANNLANQLAYLGLYDEALAVQERAVEIFAEKLGTDHQRYWTAIMNQGITYMDMGDHEKADPILTRVLESMAGRYGEDSQYLCYPLDSLASNHYSLGRHELALDLYTRSQVIAETTYGVGAYETADPIGQQGKCLVALGRLDEAVERSTRSLEIWRSGIEQDNALLADPLHDLAEVHLLRGEPAAAMTHAALSRDLCAHDLGESHPLYAKAVLLTGRAHRDLQEEEAALAAALRAEEISRRHLHHTMPILSEQLALQYADSRVEGQNLAISLLRDRESGQRVEQVWDAVIRSRAGVLDEFAARNRRLRADGDEMTAALLDSSRTLRERLANLTLRGPGWEEIPEYRRMLNEAEERLEATERKLSLRSSHPGGSDDRSGAGFRQVAAALPPTAALIAFVRGGAEPQEQRYGAFVLAGPDRQPEFVRLGAASGIDAAVEGWRDQAVFGVRIVDAPDAGGDESGSSRGFVKLKRDEAGRREAYFAAGERLRGLVWDPLSAAIGDAGQVFVVADGSLHLLSFPSLPVGPEEYLLERDVLLHNLTAEKELIVERGARVPARTLVALGGAVYGDQGAAGEEQQPADEALTESRAPHLVFGELPHAEQEVRRLGKMWSEDGQSVVMLTGEEATEQNLKQELERAEILHLATHGFFLAGSAEPSLAGRWQNPLNRAGLALAGANRWREASSGENDGILTAQEVAALDLGRLQWAVLSACDTGLGDLDSRGEGVFGLRRAFALAGARTVIMSLWSVDDEATGQWMDSLYGARRLEGASTAEAVQQASRAVLAGRREAGLSDHPFYWAGFMAAGDWR